MPGDDIIGIIADPVAKMACSKCQAELDVSSFSMFSEIACPACGAKQRVPGQLGNFLLLDILGHGGMAAVYHAYDRALGRHVAIKVMRKELGDDAKFLENFLREARAAAQLNHPNVVQIYSFGQEKRQPYIVMELMTGGRLDEMIGHGKALDEMFVLRTAVDIAEGLSAASSLGLVHGDVKPANILFDNNRVAKIADFGLARYKSHALSAGEIWGTPYYIAPEKVKKQKEDARSDIYSLGATLYHAFTTHPPFEGQTATDVVLARLKDPPPPLDEVCPDLQPLTHQLITRMLEVDPARRYPTYPSLLSDLKKDMAVVEAERKHPSAKKKKPAPLAAAKEKGDAAPPSKRRSWRRWLVALLLAAAGAAAWFFLGRDPKPAGGAVTPGPGTPSVASPGLPVQPFSPEEDREIAAGAKLLGEDKADEAVKPWLDLVKKLPEGHAGRPWIALLYAIPPWLQGQEKDTVSRLKKLDEIAYPSQADGSPHPSLLPQALARLALGKPFTRPPSKLNEDWPSWYDDFTLFCQGLSELRAKQFEAALEKLQQYDAKKGDAPAWPYAFKGVAQKWIDRLQQWIGARNEALALLQEQKPKAAVDKLNSIKAGLDPVFASEFEAALKKAQQALKLEEAKTQAAQQAEEKARQQEAERIRLEQEAAKEKERLERVQAELDVVDVLRNAARPALATKDFRGAVEALNKARDQFSTPEGKKIFSFLVESYDRLDEEKRAMMQALPGDPFRRGRAELGGDAVAASETGVRIQLLSGAGLIEKSWAQVSPRLYMEMLSQYAGGAKEPREKARAALGLALYAYLNGAYAPAQRFAASAAQTDPSLTAKIHQLMPDVLAAP